MQNSELEALQEAARKTMREAFKITEAVGEDGTLLIRGELRHGFKHKDQVHKDFELREHSTEDLFAAERLAPLGNQLTFNAALLTRQLVRLGSFEGPFTLGIIGKGIKPADFEVLRFAQQELDRLGEA